MPLCAEDDDSKRAGVVDLRDPFAEAVPDRSVPDSDDRLSFLQRSCFARPRTFLPPLPRSVCGTCAEIDTLIALDALAAGR